MVQLKGLGDPAWLRPLDGVLYLVPAPAWRESRSPSSSGPESYSLVCEFVRLVLCDDSIQVGE